mgnify:CR=1 FL=1
MFTTMVLSDSRRTPLLVESSHRHGTSGIWLHTKPDHLCTIMNTQSRMDRIITLNCSSECPHLTSVPLLPSRLSYLLSWGRMQYTRLLYSWLKSQTGMSESQGDRFTDTSYQFTNNWSTNYIWCPINSANQNTLPENPFWQLRYGYLI